MLTRSEGRFRANARGKITEAPPNPRHLWHDPDLNIDSLGCRACPEFAVCGGLRPRIPFFECLQFCCDNPLNCDRVCRNNPSFVDRVREVGTFDLQTVRRAPRLAAPIIPLVVPVVYHRTSRLTPISSKTVALPLYKMFNRRTGAIRYSSRAAVATAFGLAHNTNVLLTGTDRDRPLERWWGLGEKLRLPIIRAMKQAGVLLATTPNYSLFIDRPRWDDLHAMKRIAIVHEEFLRLGLPAALHVNGRTEDDFRRWAAFVGPRDEITHLAYEFTTGTARAGRQQLHAHWLAELATSVGRPLHLILRGGVGVVPTLSEAFDRLTLLDTTSFIKTMMRQKAYSKADATLAWMQYPTKNGAPIDSLLESNLQTTETWMGSLVSSSYPERSSVRR